MIIIGIILCIFFVLVISLLVKSYNDDIKELEDRVLQLEKRQVDFEREIKNDYQGIFIPIDDEVKLLIPLIDKNEYDIDKLKIAYQKIKLGKEEGEDMPCGTKGRPKGRHTTSRGGGRKK